MYPAIEDDELALQLKSTLWVKLPVPVNAIGDGAVEALLTRVRLPGKLPVVAGAKTTVNVVLCPSLRVMGSVRPVIE